LTPDRKYVLQALHDDRELLHKALNDVLKQRRDWLGDLRGQLARQAQLVLTAEMSNLKARSELLKALSPQAVLQRGYAIVRKDKAVVRRAKQLKKDDTIVITFADGSSQATIQK
jgi:exodeoxyribonuclease VII large subunit